MCTTIPLIVWFYWEKKVVTCDITKQLLIQLTFQVVTVYFFSQIESRDAFQCQKVNKKCINIFSVYCIVLSPSIVAPHVPTFIGTPSPPSPLPVCQVFVQDGKVIFFFSVFKRWECLTRKNLKLPINFLYIKMLIKLIREDSSDLVRYTRTYGYLTLVNLCRDLFYVVDFPITILYQYRRFLFFIVIFLLPRINHCTWQLLRKFRF